MKLIEALNWRYATKKMNGKSVPQNKIDSILNAAHLAPTSSGLQPFEIIVIKDAEIKAKILPIAMNQSQITDSSHLLVFAAWDNYTTERINNVFKRTVEERGLPADAMDGYKNMLISSYTKKAAEQNFEHAARQAYIGFGMAIAAAAELEVDATPMEGFNAAELDELLELKEKGLRSVTLLPLGYHDEQIDWLVSMKKVRTPVSEFITLL